MKIEQYIYFAILWLWVHKHFCLFYWLLPSFARLSEHPEIRSINSLQNKTKCQSRWAGSTFSLRERNATSLRITDTLTNDKCANTQWARFARKRPQNLNKEITTEAVTHKSGGASTGEGITHWTWHWCTWSSVTESHSWTWIHTDTWRTQLDLRKAHSLQVEEDFTLINLEFQAGWLEDLPVPWLEGDWAEEEDWQ